MSEVKHTLSFDEIVAKLEQTTLPVIQKWGGELEHDFENTQVKTIAARSDNNPRSIHKHFYSITLTCGEKGAIKFPDYGSIMLSIDLTQHDDTSRPIISAEVGMLVGEEGEGDWGFNHIAKPAPNRQEVGEEIFKVLEKSLPLLTIL